MKRIVLAGLSQFHGDADNFEFLVSYSDGREIGYVMSRAAAERIAKDMIAALDLDHRAEAYSAGYIEGFQHSAEGYNAEYGCDDKTSKASFDVERERCVSEYLRTQSEPNAG